MLLLGLTLLNQRTFLTVQSLSGLLLSFRKFASTSILMTAFSVVSDTSTACLATMAHLLWYHCSPFIPVLERAVWSHLVRPHPSSLSSLEKAKLILPSAARGRGHTPMTFWRSDSHSRPTLSFYLYLERHQSKLPVPVQGARIICIESGAGHVIAISNWSHLCHPKAGQEVEVFPTSCTLQPLFLLLLCIQQHQQFKLINLKLRA